MTITAPITAPIVAHPHIWQTPCGLSGETIFGADAAGAHLLIGHGLMGSRAADDCLGLPDWRQLSTRPGIASLSRYDARGHGFSVLDDDPAAYKWPVCGRDLVACAAAAPTPPTILIGSSMTAAAVLYAALDKDFRGQLRGQLRGLVLVIPPTTGAARDPMRPIYQRWAETLRAQGTTAFVEMLFSLPPTPLFARDFPDMRDHTRPHLAAMDHRALAAAFEGAAASDWPDMVDLAQLDLSCLILCRDLDATHPVAMGEELARLLPRATLSVAYDCATIRDWPELVADFCRRTL